MFNHAPLSSVLQHCKTAIVNRRFNHNHRPPFKQTIANSSLFTSHWFLWCRMNFGCLVHHFILQMKKLLLIALQELCNGKVWRLFLFVKGKQLRRTGVHYLGEMDLKFKLDLAFIWWV